MTTKALTLTAFGCCLLSSVVFWAWKFKVPVDTAIGHALPHVWGMSFFFSLAACFALGTRLIFRAERDTPGRVLGLFVLVVMEASIVWFVMLTANFVSQ